MVSALDVTEEEQEYINNNPSVIAYGLDGSAPIIYKDGEGHPTGISVIVFDGLLLEQESRSRCLLYLGLMSMIR